MRHSRVAVLLGSFTLVAIAASSHEPHSPAAHPAFRRQLQRVQLPEKPARDARPKGSSETAAIRGRILAADTGQPLPYATISLRPPGAAKDLTALTDGDGTFQFPGLSAGSYQITAWKRAYLTIEYGQRYPGQRGKPVDLREGQAIDGIEMVLPRSGVLAGTIVDDFGEPVEGAAVSLLQRRFVQGRQRLVVTAPPSYREGGFTNDLGQYRISGLAPGTYYVAARPRRSDSATDDGVTFAPTYYPGTTDMSQASRIVLKAGQELANVDFRTSEARRARVSGIVLDSHGQPVANASVYSWQRVGDPDTGMEYGTSSATTQADGRFVLQNARPGTQTLRVQATNPATAEIERATTTVYAAGDVDGVAMVTTAPIRASGRVRAEPGGDPLPSSKISVLAHSPVDGFEIRFAEASAPSGTFEMRGIPPGPSRSFDVTGLPAGWIVKGVYWQGRDIDDCGLDVAPNQNLSGIDIVVTNRTGTLSGTVAGEDGSAVTDFSLVLFSETREKWTAGSRTRSARADQNGRFALNHLKPGNYLAIAVDYLLIGEEYDPEVLEALRPSATPVAVEAGKKKTLQLRLVRRSR